MPKNYTVVNLKHTARPLIQRSSSSVCQVTAQGWSACFCDANYGPQMPRYQIKELHVSKLLSKLLHCVFNQFPAE